MKYQLTKGQKYKFQDKEFIATGFFGLTGIVYDTYKEARKNNQEHSDIYIKNNQHININDNLFHGANNIKDVCWVLEIE